MRSPEAEEDQMGSDLPFKLNMLKRWKFFLKGKDNFASSRKQGRRQIVDGKEEYIKNDTVMFQTFICRTGRRRSSFDTSEISSTPSNLNSCLRLQERLVRRQLSLTSGAVEKELFYTRRIDFTSRELTLGTHFDLFIEENIQENSDCFPCKLVTNNAMITDSDTRIVDGLLTTTLCSTEL